MLSTATSFTSILFLHTLISGEVDHQIIIAVALHFTFIVLLLLTAVTHYPFHSFLLQAIALLIMNEGESVKQKDGLGSVDQDLPHVDEDLLDVEYIDIDAEPDVILFHLTQKKSFVCQSLTY